MQPIQLPVTQVGLEQSIQAAMKKAAGTAQINLGTNSRQINALSQPLGRITGQADEFTKSMAAANARVLAFGASAGILAGVSKALSGIVTNTIKVEKSLANINVVLNKSGAELEKFGNQLFDVAKNTGQTFDQVAEAATELARQGLSASETLSRLNDSLILSRLSGLDAAKSVEGLTAAFNSFSSSGATTSEILNKLVVVSQKFAVSEKDLIEGLKRSSAVANQAGVSLDELIGIITAVQEKTARGGAVIGNSFKTIFSRIQDRKVLSDLDQIGIQVVDLQGKVLPATTILQNLATSFKSFSQLEQADIAEKLGGIYQLSNLLAAIEDLGSETSKYTEAVKLSSKATNEAYSKNAALNQTLDALINKVTVSAEQLGATLGKIGVTDSLKNVLSFFNGLLEGIQKILGEESALGDLFRGIAKGIGAFAAGPGLALFGAIILKLSKDLVQFGFASLKSFFGIGKAAKEVQNVEMSIQQILTRNVDLQQKLFALEGNRAGQLQVITNALVQQEALLRKTATTASSLAPALYNVGGRATPSGLRIGNSAGGYVPAVAKESSDISRGVGGARSGDKPVVIPNFNFGGGKRGSMVAHTGEYIVPNFAGKGSAIFNRDMVRSMGLPSGARKIGAAGGFVPNFADSNFELQVQEQLQKMSSQSFNSVKTKAEKNANNPVIQEAANRFFKSKADKQASIIDAQKILGNKMPPILTPSQGGFSESYTQNITGDKKIKWQFPAYKISGAESIVKQFQQDFSSENIRDFALKSAQKYAQMVVGLVDGAEPVDPKTIEDIDKAKGVKGFLSSMTGAFGGIFDAAITAGISTAAKESSGPANKGIGGDFDVNFSSGSKSSEIVKSLFGVKSLPNLNGVEVADFKINAGKGSTQSMAEKVLKTPQLRSFLEGPLSNAASGYIPNFASMRSVGYLDGDVLSDPQYADIVKAQIEKLGIKGGVAEYHKYLGDLVSQARAKNKIKKFTGVYGVPGAGKSTMMLGGAKAGISDDASLRKTNRIPIIRPEDIDKVSEVIDTRASLVGTMRALEGGYLSNVDRMMILSSSTPEEQAEIQRRRNLRDSQITAGNSKTAFGRSAGTSQGAMVDSGYIEAAALSILGPAKTAILGIKSNFGLSRKRGSALPTVEEKRIGLAYGAFSPSTKGHAELLNMARASGIPAEDFITAVSREGGRVDPKDPHSWRTALFPQGFRKLLAKKTFAGANVIGADPNLFQGGIPSMLEVDPINGQRRFIKAGAGSVAFVGSDKTEKDLEKYIKSGYQAIVGERTEGISGTSAREAIMGLNNEAIAKIFTKDAMAVITEYLPQLKNRSDIFPEILNRTSNKVDKKLLPVEAALAQLPSRITPKVDPAIAEQILALRETRDKMKKLKERYPNIMLKKLGQLFPSKYGLPSAAGGFIPNFKATAPERERRGSGVNRFSSVPVDLSKIDEESIPDKIFRGVRFNPNKRKDFLNKGLVGTKLTSKEIFNKKTLLRKAFNPIRSDGGGLQPATTDIRVAAAFAAGRKEIPNTDQVQTFAEKLEISPLSSPSLIQKLGDLIYQVGRTESEEKASSIEKSIKSISGFNKENLLGGIYEKTVDPNNFIKSSTISKYSKPDVADSLIKQIRTGSNLGKEPQLADLRRGIIPAEKEIRVLGGFGKVDKGYLVTAKSEEELKQQAERKELDKLEMIKKLGNVYKDENSPFNSIGANYQTEAFKSQAGGSLLAFTYRQKEMYLRSIYSTSLKDKEDLIKHIVEVAKARNLPLMPMDDLDKDDKRMLKLLNKSGIKLAPTSKKKSAAGGFLPNFANPLQAAVGREMAAGVPASQIYIDKSPSLKSAANPMGLMVANRRDEPAGGFQGINRAMREGRDPKMYGAAGGFVPNYVASEVSSSSVSSQLGGLPKIKGLNDAIDKFGKSANQAGADLDKLATALQKELKNLNVNDGINKIIVEESKKQAESIKKEKTAREESIKALQQSRASKILESESNKKLAKQLDKVYLEYNKSQKTKQDLTNAEAKAAAILQKTQLGPRTQQAIVSSTGSLATNRSSAQVGAAGNRDMLGTVFAVQGALSALGGATSDATGGLAKLTNAFSSVAGTATNFIFAGQGLSQAFGGAATKTGALIGKLGIYGAVAGGLFTAFNEYANYVDSANPAMQKAAEASFKLAEAAEKASVNLNALNPVQKRLVEQDAKDLIAGARKVPSLGIFGGTANANIEGLSFQLNKDLQSGVAQGLGVGVDRTEIFNKFNEAFKSENMLTEQEGESLLKFITERINKISAEASTSEAVKFLKDTTRSGLTEEDLASGFGVEDQLREFFKKAGISDEKIRDENIKAAQKALGTESKQKKSEEEAAVSTINLELSKSQLKNSIELAIQRSRINDALDKELRSSQVLNNLSEKQTDDLNYRIQLRDEERSLADQTKGFILDQLNQLKDIAAAEQVSKELQEELSKLTDKELNDKDKVEAIIKKINAQLSLNGKYSEATDKNNREILKGFFDQFNIKKKGIELDKESLDTAKETRDELNKILNIRNQISNKALFQNDISFLRDQAANQKRIAAIERSKIGASESQIRGADKEIAGIQLTEAQAKAAADYNKELINQRKILLELAKLKTSPALSEYSQQFNEAKTPEELAAVASRIPTEGLDQADIQAFNNAVTAMSEAFENLEVSSGMSIAAAEAQAQVAGRPNPVISGSELFRRSLFGTPEMIDEKIQQLEFEKLTTASNKRIREIEYEIETLKQQQSRPDEAASIGRQRQRKDFTEGLALGTASLQDEIDSFASTIGEQIPKMFSDNMSNAINKMIEGGESFGSVLRGAAYEFVKGINQANIKNLSDKFSNFLFKSDGGAASGIKSVLGLASGGKVSGGSGSKDDVPAMLMGGEYVINKQAVRKYGPQFFDSINKGQLSGFANGGPIQRGPQGNFYTPGTYGTGSIQGKRNLLDFATQSGTSGQFDRIVNMEGYQSIALEPESSRLTVAGMRNSPAFEATQSAKQQAFDLYLQQYRQEQEAKKAEKEQKKAFRNQLIMLAATAAIGGVGKAAMIGGKNAVATLGKDAGFLQKAGAFAKGSIFGGDIGSGIMGGGLKNLFSGNFGLAYQSEILKALPIGAGSQSSIGKSIFSTATNIAPQMTSVYNQSDMTGGNLGPPPADNQDNFDAPSLFGDRLIDYWNLGGGLKGFNKATGGMIPSTSGIDTVPAMLSGGEFIMNRAAVQNIGAGNLQSMNSGTQSVLTDEASKEMNEKLLSKLDELIEVSSGGGDITINVSGSGNETATGANNQDASSMKQQLAREVKDAVLKVLDEQKRLGGRLRR